MFEEFGIFEEGTLGWGYYYEGMSYFDVAVELYAHAVVKHYTFIPQLLGLFDVYYGSAFAADIEGIDDRAAQFQIIWYSWSPLRPTWCVGS